MLDERWLPVVGWESTHLVSDMGSVKRLARTYLHRKRYGLVPVTLPELLLVGNPCGAYRDHLQVGLADGVRKRKHAYIHVLVLEAFVGPCPQGMEALHGNEIGTDNRLENLCWGTHRQNLYDWAHSGSAIIHRGEDHYAYKLTKDQRLEIRSALASGEKQRVVAGRYGVSQATIWRVAHE